VGSERHLLCIEDPFELSHDLGRTVHWEGIDLLRKEFRRAWDVCRTSPDVAAELFLEAPEPTGLNRDRPQQPRSAGAAGGGTGGEGQGAGGREMEAEAVAAAGVGMGLVQSGRATARDAAAPEAVPAGFRVGSV
jgi:hypothetical protein